MAEDLDERALDIEARQCLKRDHHLLNVEALSLPNLRWTFAIRLNRILLLYDLWYPPSAH